MLSLDNPCNKKPQFPVANPKSTRIIFHKGERVPAPRLEDYKFGLNSFPNLHLTQHNQTITEHIKGLSHPRRQQHHHHLHQREQQQK